MAVKNELALKAAENAFDVNKLPKTSIEALYAQGMKMIAKSPPAPKKPGKKEQTLVNGSPFLIVTSLERGSFVISCYPIMDGVVKPMKAFIVEKDKPPMAVFS